MKKIYKLLILIFLIFSIHSVFSYDNKNDTDGDVVINNLDKCPGTSINSIVDSDGCSSDDLVTMQNNSGTLTDFDGDGRDNDLEINGYTGTYSLGTILIKYITTDPRLKDTDKDGLNDLDEFINKTDPRNNDTDGDGIFDGIDTDPLTLKENLPFINGSGSCDQGCKDKFDNWNIDKDSDSIPDTSEKPWCHNTKLQTIYKNGDPDYIGCSIDQKKLKLDFDNIVSGLVTQMQTTSSAINSGTGRNQEIKNFIEKYNQYNDFKNEVRRSNLDFYIYIINPISNLSVNPKILSDFITENKISFDVEGRAFTSTGSTLDIKIGDPNKGSNRGSFLDGYKQDGHFTGEITGEKGTQKFLINLAKDMKNLFIAIAVLYLIIITFRFFFGSGGEDDLKKWRSGILWTSLGIMTMQISFVAIFTMFDESIGQNTAAVFSNAILWPIIHLLELIASFIFISMAIFAFYRIITGGGNEEGYKNGIKTITGAIIGFLLIKISSALVFTIYGKVECTTNMIGVGVCNGDALGKPDLSDTIRIARDVIQFFTGFLGIFVIILIIYAGFIVLTSGGNDDKVKKAKSIIKYIVIGMILIVVSVILFEFLGGSDINGIIGSFTS